MAPTMHPSIEYPATIDGVKDVLRALDCSQNRTAADTNQSPALVSMVLSGKAKSDPCLKRLAKYINRRIRKLRTLARAS